MESLDALKEELGILHDLFSTVGNGTIRALQWERAKTVLGYLDDRIKPLEARVAELEPKKEAP